MLILSFALTADALLSGQKWVTRRVWADRTFQMYIRAWERGEVIQAVNKGLHRGGKRIGKIALTCKPYRERLDYMPDSDVTAEGGLWANKAEFISHFVDANPSMYGRHEPVAVVRFALIEPAYTERFDHIAVIERRKEAIAAGVPYCKVCGCTDVRSCLGSVMGTGHGCHWLKPGLCSHCEEHGYHLP